MKRLVPFILASLLVQSLGAHLEAEEGPAEPTGGTPTTGGETPKEEQPGTGKEGIELVALPGFDLSVDVKTVGDPPSLGLDYELSLERLLLGDEGKAGHRASFNLLSKGFTSTEREHSQNSTITEARLTGHLFWALGQLTDKQKARRKSLLDELELLKYPFPGPKGKELAREYNSMLPKSRFISFDGHVKSEADQTFTEDAQFALGAGTSFDLSIITGDNTIAKWLDAPFSLLRVKNSHFKAQSPRFYVGYDYVTDSDIEERKKLTDEDRFSRLTWQAAWRTVVFEDIQIRVAWQSYYEIDAPDEIKQADKEFTSFLEVSAAVPISATIWKKVAHEIIVKYTTGELPPTLEESSNVAVGLSVIF